ncbi:HAD-IB family hydrolase [Deinococcus soli (ex Cha et al. 2016)]|uniref:HAD superfamily hydrolase (TIGR01490 family) n=2 Tax=Deinococcus soli (ex Cha et al. 2016) TaxID=1309411 RepID=A0AAE4BMT6_9DEIO|nr:HAD-IB family hydrolase [Deinococcus soli (ex Cha et al. 2016)]MDR6218479.1 HAD superfamily hydrolase (TIGR01490 family) [Deinococcus soli (ex Cha et al. 2016)]MDR6329219.1 HAD superfamily hydrolase (TIGR01490 family) [Deinococcus soli (ex Cha et al. 2016)]MDR6751492.1 HAD superfamily hydrolase (TIGR01490 family) [Deinococcus soli (ex Cha et al. 2016)]
MSGTVIVAAFDVDGTLTRRDTFLPFLWRLAGPGLVLRVARCTPALLAYAAGKRSKTAAKSAVIEVMFAGLTPEQLQVHGRAHALALLRDGLKPEGRARLEWHQRQGHQVALVSASPDTYVRALGELLGADAALCTRIERGADGQYGIAGENCVGDEKVRRLWAWTPRSAVKELYAYGNSSGDHALLAAADHAHFRSFGAPL